MQSIPCGAALSFDANPQKHLAVEVLAAMVAPMSKSGVEIALSVTP